MRALRIDVIGLDLEPELLSARWRWPCAPCALPLRCLERSIKRVAALRLTPRSKDSIRAHGAKAGEPLISWARLGGQPHGGSGAQFFPCALPSGIGSGRVSRALGLRARLTEFGERELEGVILGTRATVTSTRDRELRPSRASRTSGCRTLQPSHALHRQQLRRLPVRSAACLAARVTWVHRRTRPAITSLETAATSWPSG